MHNISDSLNSLNVALMPTIAQLYDTVSHTDLLIYLYLFSLVYYIQYELLLVEREPLVMLLGDLFIKGM